MTLYYPPKTQGYNFHYFNKISVSWSTLGNGPACFNDGYFDGYGSDLIIPFPTYTVTFQLENLTGGHVQYSFNGISIDGDMTSTFPSINLIFQNKAISGIWFTGSGTVRVEAWALR
jgi:hypothetical protein